MKITILETSNIFGGGAWNSLRKSGFLRTLQRVIQRSLPAWIFDTNSLVAIDYDLDEWRDIRSDEKWNHMWIDQQDDHLFASSGLAFAAIQKYRRHSARAHIVMKDGETVAYNWIIPDYWEIYGWIRVRLATGEWYAAGTHVVRAYRGQRLQGELRKFAWSQLANEGHTRAVTFVERLNRSSLRSQVKAARRYVDRLTFLRIWGLVIYKLDKKWGIGFWNTTHPFELSFDKFDRTVSRPPKGAAT